MPGLVADPAGGGDVIVAPATPPGTSALAVVRLSGPPGETLSVARRLAPSLPEVPRSWGASRVGIVDAEGAPLDEGVALFFAAPRSPTGEEVVELLCHGSPAVVAALLSAARSAGARTARPGEFTRRALANGKTDLASAEGVALLARAESREEARRALGLSGGDLSQRVVALRDEAFSLLGALEASLDFPEDVAGDEDGSLRAALGALAGRARSVAARGSVAAPERLPSVVLAGRPNAGKSTLFNALLGSDRSIVAARPGTTRDVISETVPFGPIRARLLDTAGLAPDDAPCEEAETEGIGRAKRSALGADLVVYLVERGERMPEDEANLAALGELDGRTVVVGTKADLCGAGVGGGGGGGGGAVGATAAVSGGASPRVSARTGEGLELLRGLLAERLLRFEPAGEYLLLARHADALRRAADAFEGGVGGLVGARPGDDGSALAAAALREGIVALGEITGETATEELLDAIFATFCVGK